MGEFHQVGQRRLERSSTLNGTTSFSHLINTTTTALFQFLLDFRIKYAPVSFLLVNLLSTARYSLSPGITRLISRLRKCLFSQDLLDL